MERATAHDLVDVSDVLARWAYTEIVGSHFSHCYMSAGLDALRGKRRVGIAFDALCSEERSLLVCAWHAVRQFFLPCLLQVRAYRVEQWTRAQLLTVRVPPGVDPQYADYPTLAEFFSSETSDPRDPRNAHKEQGVRPSDDPLTLGLYNGDYVIGDGLHRARTFLVSSAPRTSTLPVYVPVPITAAFR